MKCGFSQSKDDRVQSHIDSDLKIIKEYLLEQNPSINTLIIAGGFGRGEGSVLIKGNAIQPINDYDIYIISNNKINHKCINKYRSDLLKLVKIRQIDIESKTIKDLKASKKTVANYDLKNASHVFYGDGKVLNNIPDFSYETIDIKESIKPLILYLISIIQSYPRKGFSENDQFWSLQQITKSILGWSMALLITKKKYNSSYIIRKKLFTIEYNNEKWNSLVSFATEFKLNPSISYDLDLTELWHDNLKSHLEVINVVFECHYKKKIKTIYDVIKYFNYDRINILRRLYGFLTKNESYKNQLNISIIELMILSSIKIDGGFDDELLINTNTELKNRFDLSGCLTFDQIMNFCIETDLNCSFWKSRGNKIFY